MSESEKSRPPGHAAHRNGSAHHARRRDDIHVHVHIHEHEGAKPGEREGPERKNGRERHEQKDERKDEQEKQEQKPEERGRRESRSPEDRRRLEKTGRIVTIGGAVLVVLCAVAVVAMWLGRRHGRARDAAARSAATDKGPVVMVAHVKMSAAQRDVILTADVRSLFQTTLYAKVAGYVRTIGVDKGDRVRKGQVLGTIESPETDQALIAARSAKVLREKLVQRAKRLAPTVMSQQDLDTAQANVEEARASVFSASAMQEYELIRAPFDAVVTARYVDPGALMPAATGGTQSALPFVDLADPNTLRVDAYVGQDVASSVKVGDAVTIWQDARPGVRVHASVTRTSAALDARSRTMLVEAQIDNRPYGILPGTFANLSLHIEAAPRPIVPSEALIFRDARNMVARVVDGHVHLVAVTLGLIDGKTVQIDSGIGPDDVVALGLPIEVEEGGAIQAQEKPEKPQANDGGAEGRGGVRSDSKSNAKPETKSGERSP